MSARRHGKKDNDVSSGCSLLHIVRSSLEPRRVHQVMKKVILGGQVALAPLLPPELYRDGIAECPRRFQYPSNREPSVSGWLQPNVTGSWRQVDDLILLLDPKLP